MNAAVTYGRYMKDVGTKTNFYMFFPESAHVQNVRDQVNGSLAVSNIVFSSPIEI